MTVLTDKIAVVTGAGRVVLEKQLQHYYMKKGRKLS